MCFIQAAHFDVEQSKLQAGSSNGIGIMLNMICSGVRQRGEGEGERKERERERERETERENIGGNFHVHQYGNIHTLKPNNSRRSQGSLSFSLRVSLIKQIT